jgi:gliding motility-associated-like protein
MLSCTNESISLSAEGSETGDDIRYEWLDTAATPLSNNPNLTVDRAGLYILKLSNTRNSCVSIDTILVSQNVNPPTSANLTVNSPTCNDTEDGVIEIENVIGGTANYEYRLDKVDQRSEPIFTDLKAGDYQLTIIDDLACEWDTMIQLVQPPSIQVSLSISNDKLVTGEDATFTMQTNVPTNNIEQIIWTPTEIFNCFNCDQFTTSLSEDTKVEVTVVDHNGCSGSDSLEVGVGLAPVPNAITPNGDGRNDLFIFPILEKDVHAFPHSELVIFNRWGDVVYQAAPYLNDWDGKNKNGKKLVEGTYYYVLRLDVREGKTQKGDITILR